MGVLLVRFVSVRLILGWPTSDEIKQVLKLFIRESSTGRVESISGSLSDDEIGHGDPKGAGYPVELRNGRHDQAPLQLGDVTTAEFAHPDQLIEGHFPLFS